MEFIVLFAFLIMVVALLASRASSPSCLGTTDNSNSPKCPKCGSERAWRPWHFAASKGGPQPHTCRPELGGCGYDEDYEVAAKRTGTNVAPRD